MRPIVTLMKRVIASVYPQIEFVRYSYSQEGEDVLLQAFYEGRENYKGFYVDIGAHHPFRFSNTYLYYTKGWSGINVDAMPGSMALFKKFRSRDINLELGVGAERGTTYFYCFDEPAFNTFDEKVALQRNAQTGMPVKQKVKVEVLTLADILNTYLPSNTQIDFLSIDVESLDYEVLSSNNWQKFRPRFVLVESTGHQGSDKITKFLREKGYIDVARSQRTIIFQNRPDAGQHSK